jgi:hypothetical protein
VQFIGGPPGTPGGPFELYVEVSSGAYAEAPDRFTISPAAEAELFKLGFQRPGAEGAVQDSQNYWTNRTVSSEEGLRGLARQTIHILQAILGAELASATIELEPNA